MKFNHSFKLTDSSQSFRLYKSEDINARLDFVSDNILRVAIYHDNDYLLPTFCICPDGEMTSLGRDRLSTKGFDLACPNVENEVITMPNGVEISVNLDNFLLSFKQNNSLLFRDRAPLAYNLQNEFGDGVCHYISRADNEKIYGLGDKSGGLNKAGKTYRIETSDSMGYDAETSDPLYKHIPFYICENSVGSYGIFYDTSCTSYMDFGREINNYYEHFKFFKSEDNALVYYVFFGTKLEILKSYSKLMGKQAFPPKWSFDYCASTMAYTDADNAGEEMDYFLKKVKEVGLSCQGFYLSSGYTSIGNQRCVFNWNTDKFPDPKAFIKSYNDAGINLIPNIKPAFLNTHPMYDMLAEKGYFVKNPDGTPFVTQFWDGLGSYLDFTNKDAYDFWNGQVKEKLLDLGMPATWNDNNEYDIKDSEALAVGFGNGKVKAKDIRSILTYLMVKSSYEAQLQKRPNERPFLSSRSGNIGVRRMAQTWSGDNFTSFHDLKFCHFIGLTMSLSGLYFYGHDLGGFSGDMPSRELLLRWIQHGIFEPRFTIHSWNEDGSATMPWSYDDIIPSVREIFSQRKQLLPYYYSCGYKAVEYDEPLNAPLFLYYDDENIKDDCQSFMVGRDILATPVLDEDEEYVMAYLPKGDDWYLNGELYDGGQEVELFIPANAKVPYFVRSGCVLPTDEGNYGFNSNEELKLIVYPVKSGTFESTFFTDDGKSFEYKNGNCTLLMFNVECNDNEVVVSYTNAGKIDIDLDISLCAGDNRKLVIK